MLNYILLTVLQRTETNRVTLRAQIASLLRKILKVLEEYEKRFPIDKVKKLKHGNVRAGGVDDKH